MQNGAERAENQELIIGVCYRSPTNSEDNNHEVAVFAGDTSKGSQVTRLLAMKDFNCPNVNFRDESYMIFVSWINFIRYKPYA